VRHSHHRLLLLLLLYSHPIVKGGCSGTSTNIFYWSNTHRRDYEKLTDFLTNPDQTEVDVRVFSDGSATGGRFCQLLGSFHD
jgi:hypothetical protein